MITYRNFGYGDITGPITNMGSKECLETISMGKNSNVINCPQGVLVTTKGNLDKNVTWQAKKY